MSVKIILLTDYKGIFGSSSRAIPYRSGFDKKLLIKLLKENGFDPMFMPMHEVVMLNNVRDIIILYTSSEDNNYYYKDFIEDIVYSLELRGAKVIPQYSFLRANNNKVFMELIRHRLGNMWNDKTKSFVFGTFEEMKSSINCFDYPIVIKTATGAMSKGVSLANNPRCLEKKIRRISKTRNLKQDIKDYLRTIKHKGYIRNSLFRKKFILQSFIPNLKNDWKILIYGEMYFVLTRHVAKDDFRASGSHTNYLAGSKSLLPKGLLSFAKQIYESLKVPHLSIDIVFDEKEFHVIEFQAVYFGTSTIDMSDIYYTFEGNQWVQKINDSSIEEYYASGFMYHYKNTMQCP